MAAGSLKILFDENFSHLQVGFVARESGLAEFQHIRKMGWSGQPDVKWIPRAVDLGFVIVSGDRNEKTRGYTVADMRDMNVRALLLGPFWDNIDGWGRAKWLVNRIERVVEIAGELTPGDVLLLDRNCGTRAA